jgi:2-hydroxy-3-oxopropionate reductase
VEAALFGPGGVAETLERGAVVVDFSTIAAARAAAFSDQLSREDGAFLLDNPVSGGPTGARDNSGRGGLVAPSLGARIVETSGLEPVQ